MIFINKVIKKIFNIEVNLMKVCVKIVLGIMFLKLRVVMVIINIQIVFYRDNVLFSLVYLSFISLFGQLGLFDRKKVLVDSVFFMREDYDNGKFVFFFFVKGVWVF